MKRTILYTLLAALIIGPSAFAFPEHAFAALGDNLRIHANPPVPAAFQRVYLTIDVPTYRDGNILKTEDPDYSGLSITWSINGENVDACQNSTYCSFLTRAAGDRFDPNNTNKFLVHVTYVGENETYGGTIVVTPVIRDVGQRDNFTQSLDCTAQSLDIIAGDIDRMEQMILDASNQIDIMLDQLDEDIGFLTDLLDFELVYSGILDDYYSIKDSIVAIGATDGTAQSVLRASAVALRTIVRTYIRGNVAQNVKHFQKIKKRYENMGSTLQAMKNAKVRYVKNMTDQLNRQTALCEKQWSKVDTHGL